MLEDCMWKKCQNVPILQQVSAKLSNEFSLPPAKKFAVYNPTKPVIKLRVIGERVAQNLEILCRIHHKNTFEYIPEYILNCDESNLNVNFIEGLIKCVPNPHEIEKLLKCKKNNDDLFAIEDHLAHLCKFEDIVPRLQCIQFKIRFHDIVAHVQYNIQTALKACDEILSSQKFANVLKVILAIGNFMNSGSNLGQAVGFHLGVLPNLKSIKAKSGNRNLLHSLAETLDNDLMTFSDDLTTSSDAARVKIRDIDETMAELAEADNNLKVQLTKQTKEKVPEDKFQDVMSAFSLECGEKIRLLEHQVNALKSSYVNIANYFSFDANKYPMEQLFADVCSFKKQFTQTCADMAKNSNSKLQQKKHPKKQQNIVKAAPRKEKHSCILFIIFDWPV